jgi:predicted phage terminase large subunit-like protein
MFGLRLGQNPQCVITTTPKPTPLVKNLLKREGTIVTRGSTFDNAENLAPAALQQLKEKYEGTRLGRQELYAEVLEDVEGALWNWNMIEGCRIKPNQIPDLQRIVVAIDPAVTNTDTSDETGIVVAGRTNEGKFYVLEDRSLYGSPDTWAREAIDAFHKYNADRLIAEVNNGGDLVERVVRTIDRQIPYTAVRASRGKMIRAEPIAALYEQGKVHHVGEFKKLEEQLTTFTPDARKSPDRLDALVWAITELSSRSGQPVWRIS